jgi:membrane-bound ClpP family serine protease
MAETVPAFDFRRWGVGGVLIISALFASGLITFVDGILRESVRLQVLGSICVGGGILLLAIKLGEDIHPVVSKWGMVGEVGEVVKEVDRHAKGIVRVRSELWSARSETRISAGAKIRVARVEGLHVWVVKPEEARAQIQAK